MCENSYFDLLSLISPANLQGVLCGDTSKTKEGGLFEDDS
jgi:hypothetical protein